MMAVAMPEEVIELLKQDFECTLTARDLFGSDASSDDDEVSLATTNKADGEYIAPRQALFQEGPCLSETSSSDDESSCPSPKLRNPSSTNHGDEADNEGRMDEETTLQSVGSSEDVRETKKPRLDENLEAPGRTNNEPRLDTPQLQCREVIGRRRSTAVRKVARDTSSSDEDDEGAIQITPAESFFNDRRLTAVPVEQLETCEAAEDAGQSNVANEYDIAHGLQKLRASPLRTRKVTDAPSIKHFAIHPSVNPLLFAAVDGMNALSFWKFVIDDHAPYLFPTSAVLQMGNIPVRYKHGETKVAFSVSWMDFQPTEPGSLFLTTTHGNLIVYDLAKGQVKFTYTDDFPFDYNYLCAALADHQTMVVGSTYGTVKLFDTRVSLLKKPCLMCRVEAHESFDIASIAVHPQRTSLWAVSAKGEDRVGNSIRPGYLFDTRNPSEAVVPLGDDVLDFSFSPTGEFLAARKCPLLLTKDDPTLVEFYLTDGLYRYCGTDYSSPAMSILAGDDSSGSIDAELYSFGKVHECPAREAQDEEKPPVHTGCWVPGTSGSVYLTGKAQSKKISIVKPTGKELGQLDPTKALALHGNGASFGGSCIAANIVRHHRATDIVAATVEDHVVFFARDYLF